MLLVTNLTSLCIINLIVANVRSICIGIFPFGRFLHKEFKIKLLVSISTAGLALQFLLNLDGFQDRKVKSNIEVGITASSLDIENLHFM